MSKRFVFGLASTLFVGCGGDGGGDNTGAECGSITIDVVLTDPTGAPIEGADVNIDNEIDCTEGAGGNYSCTVPGPGEYNLYATMTPEFGPFGSQIVASCDANPMTREVTLNYENGGL